MLTINEMPRRNDFDNSMFDTSLHANNVKYFWIFAYPKVKSRKEAAERRRIQSFPVALITDVRLKMRCSRGIAIISTPWHTGTP